MTDLNVEDLNKAVNTQVFDYSTLKDAAALLKQGKLVAFPTETVYGLGAIANNETAVRGVFQAKGRPEDNPLIVHVSDISQVHDTVANVSPLAQRLMETFWPGPLTIIFPLKEGVFAPNVTPGKKSVAVRMPRQMETLLLIEMVGFPLVGPSANLSGKPSPTAVEHVLNDFSGTISGVIKAQSPISEIGVESTVVLADDEQIVILRPGAITQNMLKKIAPVVEMTASQQLANKDVQSPGVKYLHYSPEQPVYLIPIEYTVSDWLKEMDKQDRKIGVLADEKLLKALEANKSFYSSYSLGSEGDVASATRQLYAGLRYLEQSSCEIIFAQALLDDDAGHAYMNRLTKASNYVL
ncbi:L-threonylcarbamoyladenylate synthase [Fundicoccus ignavus]|uniref:Threonylcarbamoyl-AMP synthase n=1 Tax=Fundicoccus ignavus TaxID=2664442 RepID=A0A844C6R0_9LACT|nr:L-threonylcarbamoyladenylate synthase [Fundicoccus ignavus]MRJ46746.1 threonylcarbamoyl-AMP synthase [Fundicoccus ignavus]